MELLNVDTNKPKLVVSVEEALALIASLAIAVQSTRKPGGGVPFTAPSVVCTSTPKFKARPGSLTVIVE